MIRFLRTYALAFLAGLLLALAYPKLNLFPLAWVGLVPLFFAVRKSSPVQAAFQFFAAGWLFHTVVLQWLIANIYWAGGWAVIGQQALVLGLAVFWGVAGLLWRWAHRRSPRFGGAILFALLWGAVEWCHAHLFTGFGWSALAYSQGPNLAVLQWAAVGGVALVSFFMALTNGLAGLAVIEGRARLKRLGALAGVLLIANGGGALLLREASYENSPGQAALVQSNFAQQMKWDNEYIEEMVFNTFTKSRALAREAEPDLFVWPEALLMRDFRNPNLMKWLEELTVSEEAPLYTGTVRRGEDGENFNSSVLIDQTGAVVDHYDKVHLAPFGEYVPFEEYLPFLRQVVLGSVDAGDEQKMLSTGPWKLGPLICFEVLFAPMAERLRAMGANTLVVITNLGWFGFSNGVAQELELARLRAIETRLPLIHCANTGISGVFDPYGRFQVVRGYLAGGRYYKQSDRALRPALTVMQRRGDVLPVAAPASRPVPYGPVVIPYLLLAAAAVWFMGAVVLPGRPTPPPAPGGYPPANQPAPPPAPPWPHQEQRLPGGQPPYHGSDEPPPRFPP